MGWLANKIRLGRITMHIKELKWDLMSSDINRKARILLLAHDYRFKTIPIETEAWEATKNPQNFPADSLLSLVSTFEDVIIEGQKVSDSLMRRAKEIGLSTDRMSRELLDLRRSVQVWICTLGGAMSKKYEPEMIEIFRLLCQGLPKLEEEFDLHNRYAEISGSGQIAVPIEIFQEICREVPTIYRANNLSLG